MFSFQVKFAEVNPKVLEQAQKYFANNIDEIVNQVLSKVELKETPALRNKILDAAKEIVEAYFEEYLRYVDNVEEAKEDMPKIKSDISQLIYNDVENNFDDYFKLTK